MVSEKRKIKKLGVFVRQSDNQLEASGILGNARETQRFIFHGAI